MKRSSALPLSEADVAKQVKDFLVWRKWRAVRMQRTVVPGQFQTGEPGIPDFLFLRYLPDGVTLTLWVEFKKPTDRRGCRCRPGKTTLCTQCAQAKWKERERRLGAVVVEVSDLDAFHRWYDREYGWLHTGKSGVGQLQLEAAP